MHALRAIFHHNIVCLLPALKHYLQNIYCSIQHVPLASALIQSQMHAEVLSDHKSLSSPTSTSSRMNLIYLFYIVIILHIFVCVQWIWLGGRAPIVAWHICNWGHYVTAFLGRQRCNRWFTQSYRKFNYWSLNIKWLFHIEQRSTPLFSLYCLML